MLKMVESITTMRGAVLVVLASLVVVTMEAAAKFEAIEEWHLWKTEHGRQYSSTNEELERHIIWLSNKKYIEEHNTNAEIFGYTLSLNRFGDLTSQEFNELHTCYHHMNITKSDRLTYKSFRSPKFLNLPDTVDWRTKNAVSDIKDQGQCGSCYAFSATGALEGAHALATDKLVSLSEQNVLDCSVPYGNHGCQGGNVHNVYEYVVDNQGIDTKASYPYKGRQAQCQYNKNYIGATQAGVVVIPSGSEDDLQAATATAGPVSVAVDASSNAFRFYEGGVFDEPNCYSESSRLTHSLLIIGYGTYKNKDYWLVKNSWGANWGMGGYIMMARSKSNQCGIATAASFPTL